MSIRAGIWLDLRNAVLVVIHESEESIIDIASGVEERKVHGGYGGSKKHLPQDSQSDKKLQARKAKQIKQYFSSIVKQLPIPERLYVFGPGEARKLLVRDLRDRSRFSKTRIVQEAADQMTTRQIHAQVLSYFKIDKQKVSATAVKPESSGESLVIHEFVRMRASKATETMVNEKIAALTTRYPKIIRAKAFYKKEKDPRANDFVCEMEISIPGENVFASSRGAELAIAIHETLGDLERQLRKRSRRR